MMFQPVGRQENVPSVEKQRDDAVCIQKDDVINLVIDLETKSVQDFIDTYFPAP